MGDGGSNELEAAQRLGMQVVQAVWYLKEGINQVFAPCCWDSCIVNLVCDWLTGFFKIENSVNHFLDKS